MLKTVSENNPTPPGWILLSSFSSWEEKYGSVCTMSLLQTPAQLPLPFRVPLQAIFHRCRTWGLARAPLALHFRCLTVHTEKADFTSHSNEIWDWQILVGFHRETRAIANCQRLQKYLGKLSLNALSILTSFPRRLFLAAVGGRTLG